MGTASFRLRFCKQADVDALEDDIVYGDFVKTAFGNGADEDGVVFRNKHLKDCLFKDFSGKLRFENCTLTACQIVGGRVSFQSSSIVESRISDAPRVEIRGCVLTNAAIMRVAYLLTEETETQSYTYIQSCRALRWDAQSTTLANVYISGISATLRWDGVRLIDSFMVDATVIRGSYLKHVSLKNTATSRVVVEAGVTRRDCGLFPRKVLRCNVCGEVVSRFPVDGKRVCGPCLHAAEYDTHNTKWRGVPVKLPPFSFEFEMRGTLTSASEAAEKGAGLIELGFIPTHDRSVVLELKSPIYRNLHAAEAAFREAERLAVYVTDNCDTHLHVGVSEPVKIRARKHWEELFTPLGRYLRAHVDECELFWGQEIEGGSHNYRYTGDRKCWLNPLTKTPTLEFRLPVFRSAVQYRHVVRFCRGLVAWLEAELDRTREDEFYEWAGGEIVRMWERAYARFLKATGAENVLAR